MLRNSTLDIIGNIILITVAVLLSVDGVLGGRNFRGRIYHRPRFLPGEKNFTYTQGDTATLVCRIADLGTKTPDGDYPFIVTWKKKNSNTPLTIGTMAFVNNKDYEVFHPTESSEDWSLLIKNVQHEHAGEYQCIISTADKLNITVHLNIVDPRTTAEPDISIKGQLHIDKGQQIELRCNAVGTANPPDAIDWFKDGLKLETNSQTGITITKDFSIPAKTMTSELTKQSAVMEDAGTYTCRTSDLQVTSEIVNVLNAGERSVNKRVTGDGDKPQANIMGTSGGGHLYTFKYTNRNIVFYITALLMTSVLTSLCDVR